MSPPRHQSNLAADLERYLPPEALHLLKEATEVARAEGSPKLYLVGGIVRDLLLGRPSLDLDLVVEGEAIRLAQALAGRLAGRVVTHQRFQTATVYVESTVLDLATARTESYPKPGALPVVRPGVIADDLRRRDFTINAMALSLAPSTYGEITDPLDGQADISAGLVRAIHEGSFIDDATRILRAVRYAQRFDFRLEESTESMARRDAHMLSAISGDRVRHELQRIWEEERPERALERAHELGVLQAIHPALGWDPWLSQHLTRAREARSGSQVYTALLTYRLTEHQLAAVAQRLRFPGSWTRTAQEAQRLASSLPALEAPGLPASRLHEALEGYSPEAVAACRIASGSAIVQERLGLYLDKLRKIKPLLSGRDLLGLGVAEGPRVGEALAQLKRARLDREVRTRKEESAFVERWLHDSKSG